ncbi:YwgA family protein [Bacillus fonticola]|uniref:YwgA family protein n=1 Tax=Bacillus fonticola TaxID=2728853 RepID=UPI001475F140|nr:YwgA family protein [Bacillus fonticola]
MLKDHANVLGAISASGEIIGRKKLQKMVYIAKRLQFPFQEKFQYHFYGPYSEELTLRVEELCDMGFLQEVKEKKGGYIQYRYALAEAGDEFLEHVGRPDAALQSVLTNMNDKSSRFLELVSTVLYFEHLPKAEVTEKIFTLKSKNRYTVEEVEEAYTYIASLREQAPLS